MSSSLFPLFQQFPNLFVAMSTKIDGSMKINEPAVAAKGWENREKFLEKYGIARSATVALHLVHGNTVVVVNKNNAGKIILQTDGLITKEKQLFLTLTVADCLPMFFYDTQKQVVGLVHAGWRGLDNEIVKHTVNVFRQVGCNPEDIFVGIGPGIGPCHFEVQEDLLEKFKDYPEALQERDGKHFLDLKKIALLQLLDLGFNKDHIDISPLCTYDEVNTYFSHRRDKTDPIQTMLAVIGMK